MPAAECGFYRLGDNIYYGNYPVEQVSGRVRLSAVKPDFIKTDVPFGGDDFAVNLWSNHAALPQEISELSECMSIILRALNVADSKEQFDFKPTEDRLQITLPQEVKILLTTLESADLYDNNFVGGGEHFLPPQELYLDGENLIFYKIKRTPVAISLQTGQLMKYYKKEWILDEGGTSFVTYAMERATVHAISKMPIIRKGRGKGELATVLNPKKKLAEIYGDKLAVTEQYRNYCNVCLYSDNGALAWFRQNGSYADILLGAVNENVSDEITAVDSGIVWEIN